MTFLSYASFSKARDFLPSNIYANKFCTLCSRQLSSWSFLVVVAKDPSANDRLVQCPLLCGFEKIFFRQTEPK